MDGYPTIRFMVNDALISAGMTAHPKIRELDLNPVRAYPNGVQVIDTLVIH